MIMDKFEVFLYIIGPVYLDGNLTFPPLLLLLSAAVTLHVTEKHYHMSSSGQYKKASLKGVNELSLRKIAHSLYMISSLLEKTGRPDTHVPMHTLLCTVVPNLGSGKKIKCKDIFVILTAF